MPLLVNEIFHSIQGESSYIGRPCVFIRLTGCNLRCSYCDTSYAYFEGKQMAISEVIQEVDFFGCPLVEITGGEPLIQEETPELISALLERGQKVLLETNGSLDTSHIDIRCVKIVDIKCPSSGEHEKTSLDNLNALTFRDEIKFVISDKRDYEYAKEVLKRVHGDVIKKNRVHFSPVYGIMDPKVLARWILDDRLDVTLSLQLHKTIWGPDKRGV